jgi:hypothetical protein
MILLYHSHGCLSFDLLALQLLLCSHCASESNAKDQIQVREVTDFDTW